MKRKRFIIIAIVFMTIAIVILRQTKSNENIKLIKNWVKYSNEPVLGNKDTGPIFDPYVMKDENGKYIMYVSWRKEKAIAVTTSDDGINWAELKIVLNNDTSTGWENDVNRATVVYKDGIYYMWYTGQSNNVSKIGYATSEDGYTFKKGEGPILIPEKNYEKQSVMNPCVIYDEDEQIFKMWYAAGETYEPDVIAYATSKDGIHWNKYENNPILEKNTDILTKDNFKVGACEVHKIKNEYVMFYIGYTDIDTARIFVAKSKNGITNWKRYGRTPIVKPTKGTFDESACYKPTVVFDEINNRYMLWYNGRYKTNEYIGLSICNLNKF